MARETEVKLRVASLDEVRERLRALGATFVRRGVETSRIFDRPDAGLRRQGVGLRVRSVRADEGEPGAATLTFKGPRQPGPLKVREELELTINSASTALRLLERLGFTQVLRYEKRRETWRWQRCTVELDEPPGIGTYVEIEGPDAAAIEAVQTELGLQEAEPEQRSYVSLLLAYCEEQNRVDRDLRLG
ncbi:MAG TPA: class IV adenylate cyclase [Phycisphaerae bacterium]|nr:class IV adenylate cyclase [Phycisphaerae bacterium]HNU45807.1 class IV adenylate cyclase [Phycisphaerae bacterium]